VPAPRFLQFLVHFDSHFRRLFISLCIELSLEEVIGHLLYYCE
jgi:hypothetical protein